MTVIRIIAVQYNSVTTLAEYKISTKDPSIFAPSDDSVVLSCVRFHKKTPLKVVKENSQISLVRQSNLLKGGGSRNVYFQILEYLSTSEDLLDYPGQRLDSAPRPTGYIETYQENIKAIEKEMLHICEKEKESGARLKLNQISAAQFPQHDHKGYLITNNFE